ERVGEGLGRELIFRLLGEHEPVDEEGDERQEQDAHDGHESIAPEEIPHCVHGRNPFKNASARLERLLSTQYEPWWHLTAICHYRERIASCSTLPRTTLQEATRRKCGFARPAA